MANTYTQLHVQFIFAVKYRASLIQKQWKDKLHAYISGIIQENDHKLLQINSMPDHLHVFCRGATASINFIVDAKCKSGKQQVY